MTSPHPRWTRDGANWPNRAHSRFVTAGGVAWHVQQMGDGQNLLLLHGSGAATHSWRDMLPDLATDHSVTAPDLPGHGFSRADGRRRLSLDGMSRAVRDLCAALPVAPDVIIGHSAGAAVAINATLNGWLSPHVLIGINPALTPFRGLAGLLFPPMARLMAMNPLTPWVFSQIAGNRDTAARLIGGTGSTIDADGMREYTNLMSRSDHVGGALSMMAQWDLPPMLARLQDLPCPLHLIVSEGDRTVPPDEAFRIAARHPGITLHRVAHGGHLLHEEDPGGITRQIRDILSNADEGPGRAGTGKPTKPAAER